MRKLIMGIVEFREQRLPDYAARFRELGDGQSPDAFLVTCADSRIVPELIAQCEPGTLFAMRNVGNLLPPATIDGLSTGDLSEASAIEYAVTVLKVPHVIVCGHSGCGAMKAVLAAAPLDDAPNLSQWLLHAAPAAERLKRGGTLDASLKAYDQLSQLNVLAQIDHLMTYPFVKERVRKGTLELDGWWFDVPTGNMHAYDPKARLFTVIDRKFADRLLDQVGP